METVDRFCPVRHMQAVRQKKVARDLEEQRTALLAKEATLASAQADVEQRQAVLAVAEASLASERAALESAVAEMSQRAAAVADAELKTKV